MQTNLMILLACDIFVQSIRKFGQFLKLHHNVTKQNRYQKVKYMLF